MKCVCGGTTRVIETRGNDYNVYRIRRCLVCGKEFVTQEIKINASEGKNMMRKIYNVKYGKVRTEKRRRRRKRE